MSDFNQEVWERLARLEETDKDQSQDIADLKRERNSSIEWTRGPLVMALLTTISIVISVVLAVTH